MPLEGNQGRQQARGGRLKQHRQRYQGGEAMKRGRRNGKSITKEEFEKRMRTMTREKLQAFKNGPDYAPIMFALFRAAKLPVEHWAMVYVLEDFADGRIEFNATDEELAE